MPKHIIEWSWEEAFSKWGFNDGDGPNFTDEVAEFLEGLGYKVECDSWGCHNYLIQQLSLNGQDLLAKPINVGYDDPWDYLPTELLDKLEEHFGMREEINPLTLPDTLLEIITREVLL